MSYLLDTNVVSQTSKAQPNAGVMSWWKQQDERSLLLSAIVFQELRFGIEMLGPGKKRDSSKSGWRFGCATSLSAGYCP